MQFEFANLDAEFSLDQINCLWATVAWFVFVAFLFYIMVSAFYKKGGKFSAKRIAGDIIVSLFIILFSSLAQKMGASFFAWYLALVSVAYPFGRAPLWPIIPSIIIGSALGVIVTRKKYLRSKNTFHEACSTKKA